VRETLREPLRAAAITAFTVGTLLFLINPPSLSGVEELITWIGGGLALVVITAWGTVALAGDGLSEEEVERITDRSEALAVLEPPERPPDEFDQLVIDAIDELPEETRDILASVPIVVSHLGREYRAYGHYYGGGVARDQYEKRIVIYRDTLERDFGEDPELLQAQVERTLRHEVAHHLGWGERGVRELGL